MVRYQRASEPLNTTLYMTILLQLAFCSQGYW